MNRHFARPYDGPMSFPSRAYGRFQSFELNTESRKATLHYDLIGADWLDAELRNLPLTRGAGGRYVSRVHGWVMARLLNGQNPLEDAPLLRLELTRSFDELCAAGGLLDTFTGRTIEDTLDAAHDHWAEFHCMTTATPGAGAAVVYPGLFAPPLPVHVRGKLITAKKHRGLWTLHTLSYFQSISCLQFQCELDRSQSSALAIYDVGQGNANALLEPLYNRPTLYYDLGAGIYANRDTTPVDLRFCFSEDPTIVLSHWDTDHWAGAYARDLGGRYPALDQTWIAPNQEPSSIHMAFAFDIQLGRGRLCIYDVPPHRIQSTFNASGHLIRYWRGDGKDNNGSGLVIEVMNPAEVAAPAWLLTGDCDYYHFPARWTSRPYVAIVAPHHGADLKKTTQVPPPSPGYARLVYSYGPNNTHAGTSHPTVHGVAAHNCVGWAHDLPFLSKPGHSAPPGRDVRATGFHFAGATRGGVLIGWTAAPAVMATPCGGRCTITPTQN